MRHLESWLQVNPKNKKEVIVVNMYIDSFGKYFTESSCFDSFSSESQVFGNKDLLDKQAHNCLNNYRGWKL